MDYRKQLITTARYKDWILVYFCLLLLISLCFGTEVDECNIHDSKKLNNRDKSKMLLGVVN